MKTRSYSDLIARLEAIKSAADGADTSMPEDPSGDGTLDPQTGSQYSQYSKDIKNIDTVPPNAEDQPRASMSEDHEQENSFSSYTLSTAGSPEQSAKGEYTDRADDPGTSMPAEAGQEKYSAFNCTLEENIDVFEKCAQALIQTSQQYNQAVKQAAAAVNNVCQYPVGTLTKRAMDDGASPAEVDEVAALEALVQENPELLANLESLSPEELDALAAVADQMDAEAATGVPADVTPEDVALEKDSFYRQEPEIQRTLVSLDDGQLKQASANLDVLMQKVAEGDITEEELAAILEPADNPVEVVEDAPESKEEAKEDGEEKEGCGGKCKKANYTMTAEDLYKQASPQQLYYLAMKKQAEEDQVAFESLSPEEQAMLESASDEELAQAVADSEAAAEDPSALEAILSEDEAPAEEEPSSDEALNELAAAMDEQGITPEALEAASKEASADPDLCKIAQAVMQYRKAGNYRYAPATTEKAAKMRSISHKYLSEIFPHK